MTIQECYQQLGGDYSQMEKRLPSAKLIQKFIAKFPNDGSYAELCQAMQTGDCAQAFRAAHTLKGVCGNLSLDRLCHSASALTELLRAEADSIPEEAVPLMETVKQDYEITIGAIRTYLASVE